MQFTHYFLVVPVTCQLFCQRNHLRAVLLMPDISKSWNHAETPHLSIGLRILEDLSYHRLLENKDQKKNHDLVSTNNKSFCLCQHCYCIFNYIWLEASFEQKFLAIEEKIHSFCSTCFCFVA